MGRVCICRLPFGSEKYQPNIECEKYANCSVWNSVTNLLTYLLVRTVDVLPVVRKQQV